MRVLLDFSEFGSVGNDKVMTLTITVLAFAWK